MIPPVTSQHLPQTSRSIYNSITARSVLIGMAAVVCQCLATPYNDFRVEGTYLAGNHLPITVVFVMLIFILGVNILLKRLTPSAKLQDSKLLIIWRGKRHNQNHI